MAIKFERSSYPGYIDAFWRADVKILPGGFSLKQTVPTGEVVRRGSLVAVDCDTMSAALVKTGIVLNGGTTTKPRVSKNNNFVAGDTVMKVGKTDLAVTVKSVDHSNTGYDIVEFDKALTTLAEGDYLQEAVKGSDSTYGAAYVANAVVATDYVSRESGLPALDVAYSALVLKDVCQQFPASFLADNSFCLATNHNILFIRQ